MVQMWHEALQRWKAINPSLPGNAARAAGMAVDKRTAATTIAQIARHFIALPPDRKQSAILRCASAHPPTWEGTGGDRPTSGGGVDPGRAWAAARHHP